MTDIVEYINNPRLPNLIQQFLYHQLSNNSNASVSDASVSTLPAITNKIYLYSSASSVFFAPSNPCGIHGLRREQIRSTWQWQGGPLWQDTVLVNTGQGGDAHLPISGYVVAWVLLFFLFTYACEQYPVALVWWYILSNRSRHRDRVTGMWLVECKYRDGEPHLAVVHVDTILRAVHLLLFFGPEPVILGLTQDNSLDMYRTFYVNRYADHQLFEIL